MHQLIDSDYMLPFQQLLLDEYYRNQSLTNDAFYFGLPDVIEKRQQQRVPIAGQGSYEFFTLLGHTVSYIGKVTKIAPIAAAGEVISAVGDFALGYNPDIVPIR